MKSQLAVTLCSHSALPRHRCDDIQVKQKRSLHFSACSRDVKVSTYGRQIMTTGEQCAGEFRFFFFGSKVMLSKLKVSWQAFLLLSYEENIM